MQDKRRDSKGRILRNGEVQRADGKYMFRYVDAVGIRRTVYSWKLVDTDKVPEGKKHGEALREIEKQLMRDKEDGIRSYDANVLTVNDLFSAFMKRRTDLRKTTRCNYVNLYNTQLRDEIGYKKLSSLKFSDIQKLYVGMVKQKGLSVSTVHSVHSILYQILDSAVMDNVIRSNPSANVLKSLKKMFSHETPKRHALTEEEQAHFIEYIHNTDAFKRWGTLFTVLLGTGMRIGEALGLRWCDCNFEKDLIYIDHTLLYKGNETGEYEYRISEPKTASGRRIIPMFSEVRTALLNAKANRRERLDHFSVDGYTDFVFLNNCGKVFTPAAVYDALQKIVAEHNKAERVNAVKEDREPCLLPKISAHIFRHTFCTRLCENEPNIKVVQEVMGHKNIRTTMDVYNEATESKKIASFKELEGKIRLS